MRVINAVPPVTGFGWDLEDRAASPVPCPAAGAGPLCAGPGRCWIQRLGVVRTGKFAMKWRSDFLFAVSLLLLIPDGHASEDVVILDSENFDRLMKESVWFVNFYAPW
jgi:hypothetical protein